MCAMCALNNRKRAAWSAGLALVCLSIFARAADTRKTQELSELRALQAGITLSGGGVWAPPAGRAEHGAGLFVFRTRRGPRVLGRHPIQRGVVPGGVVMTGVRGV